MPTKKFQPPPYPRPVSPICADEIPVCKDTVIFYDTDYDFESDTEQKEAKRRRIEAHATNYLRGQSLFILTAGLKGPFEDGWRNPWAKKSRGGIEKKTATTQQRSGQDWNPQKSTDAVPRLSITKRGRDLSAVQSTGLSKRKRDPSASERDSGLNEAFKKSPTRPDGLGKMKVKKDSKMGEWLKTSDEYTTLDIVQPNSPPPPSPLEGKVRNRKTAGRSRPNAVDRDDIVDGNRPVLPARAGTRERLSLPSTNCRRISPQQKDGPLAQRPHEDESRAEYSILKAKGVTAQPDTRVVGTTSREFCHIQPVMNTGAASSPPSNVGMVPSKSVEAIDLPDMTDDPLTSNYGQGSHTAAAKGLSSTRTAVQTEAPQSLMPGSNGTPELPSAQLPQVAMLPSLPSDISSHERLLPDCPQHPMPPAVEAEGIIIPPILEVVSIDGIGNFLQKSAPERGPAPSAPAGVPDARDGLRSDGEYNASTLSESNFVSVGALAARRSAVAISRSTGTVGSRNAGVQKLKKRQGFASEEKPSGSIKSALKVGKWSGAKPPDIQSSKPAPTYPDDEQGKENNLHNPVRPEEVSPTVSRAAPSKGILKSSFQNPVAISVSTRSGSLSGKQDAQPQKNLKPIENDDDFDLEGAMDDLGSYLDTWDAEKQAAGIS